MRDEVRKATALVPLVLDEAGMTMVDEETQVDVTGDPWRMGYHDGRRVLIPGIRVRVSVPFTGDPDLWQCQPNPHSQALYARGDVQAGKGNRTGSVVLTFEQPADEPAEQLKLKLGQALGEIRQAIQWQGDQIRAHEGSINGHIDAAIADRRARLGKRGTLSDLMGIKRAEASAPVTQQVPPSPAARSAPKATFQWDAFISHASGDKEEFVRPLAVALEARGFKVWFDESTLKLGDSLRRKIDDGLLKSRYGIVVLSPTFFARDWPQKELDGLGRVNTN